MDLLKTSNKLRSIVTEEPLSAVAKLFDNDALDMRDLMSPYSSCSSIYNSLKDRVRARFLHCDDSTDNEWRLSFLKLNKLFVSSGSSGIRLKIYTKLSGHPIFQHYSHVLLAPTDTDRVEYLPPAVLLKLKNSPNKDIKVPAIALLQRGLHPDIVYALVNMNAELFLKDWDANSSFNSFWAFRELPKYFLGHPLMNLLARKAPVDLLDIWGTSVLLEYGLPRGVNREVYVLVSKLKPLPEPRRIKVVLGHIWSCVPFMKLLRTQPKETSLHPEVFLHALRLGLSPRSIHFIFITYHSCMLFDAEVIERLFNYKLEDKEMLEVLIAIKDKVEVNANTMALAPKNNRSEFSLSWLRQYC